MGTVAGDHPSGDVMYGTASPTPARLMLGLRIRQHREASGFTREQAGQAIGAPTSTIVNLETGRTEVELRTIIDLCEAYGVDEHSERTTLLGLGRESNVSAWWAPYNNVIPPWFEYFLGLEQAAHMIRCFEVQRVPGLVQIPDYAHGLITLVHGDAADSDVQRRLELQQRRQQILHRPDPPHLWMVLDEAVLRRPIGGRSTMFRQLQYLIDVCDMPRVTVQVVPFAAGGHAGAGGPITVLGFQPGLPQVVYLEQLTTAIYLDGLAEADFYRHVLNLLTTRDAAPPAQTPAILDQIMREL